MMSGGAPYNNNVDLVVRRRVLNNSDLLSNCPPKKQHRHSSVCALAQKRMEEFDFGTFWRSMFPLCSFLATGYDRRLLLHDIIAGLTVSSLHVPQGMAYGQLAGVKPINGIYTSFFPAVVYILFGTSRHISIGTFSVMSLLVAEPVDRLSESYVLDNHTNSKGYLSLDDYRLEVAVTVTVVVGIIQFLTGLFHLGLLVVYISPAILGGFTCGAAVHVFASQLNGLFGIRLQRFIGPGRLLFTAQNFWFTVSRTNLVTFSLSVSCILVLAIFKFYINPRVYSKLRFPLPIELILLVAVTATSYFMDLNQNYGVAIAGTLPKGLPSPKVPDFSIATHVWVECVIAAFVSLATTMSVIKFYATRNAYSVDYTREMSALGLANIFGGFFQCHACSGGLARTSVAVGAGMHSQVANVVSCSVLLLVLTSIGPLLKTLPLCVLSCIITISLKGILVQILDLPRLYRCSLVDLGIWVISFLATVLVDIPFGLLIGFSYSLITILYRTHLTEKRTLGRVPGTNIYLSQEHFDGVSSLPGITLLQAAGPIYYVNADAFRNWLIHSTGIDPFKHLASVDSTKIGSCTNKKQSSWLKSIGRRLRNRSGHQGHRVSFSVYEENDEKKEGAAGLQWDVVHTDLEHSKTPPSPGSKFIILDLSGCSFIDAVGADVLIEVIRKYNNCGIQILLSHCSQQVQRVLVSSEFDSQQLDKISFPTIHDAVTYAENTLSGSVAPAQDTDPNTEGSETVDKTFRF